MNDQHGGWARLSYAATSVLAVFAVGVVIAACGSSSLSGSSSATGSSFSSGSVSTALHDDAVSFARCMRANGVPSFPDPAGNGVGVMGDLMKGPHGQTISVNGVSVNSPAFRTAISNCQQYMPQPSAPSNADLAQARAQGLKYARCMRSHGFRNFPDPDPQPGPGGHGIARNEGYPPGFDSNSPAAEAANQTCETESNF